VYVDDSRRRAEESERQNRANQDAILRLLDEIGNLANGDLTVRAKVTEDVTGAIADSINYTIDELRRLVTGINGAAQQVTSATQEAQAVAGQLLQAAQKQAGEIQGTGQAVAQMTVSMQEVSRSANDSANVARTSLGAAPANDLDGTINDGCPAAGQCQDPTGATTVLQTTTCTTADDAIEILTPLVDGNNSSASLVTNGTCNTCSITGTTDPEIWGVGPTSTPLAASW
jgi:uncharacterized phage infection (PIP) family protein YhgE